MSIKFYSNCKLYFLIQKTKFYNKPKKYDSGIIGSSELNIMWRTQSKGLYK